MYCWTLILLVTQTILTINASHVSTVEEYVKLANQGYVPIDVFLRNYGSKLEGTVHLCQIDHAKHAETPWLYAMFRVLVKASNCRSNTLTVPLSIVRESMSSIRKLYSESPEEYYRKYPNMPPPIPQGFVFHEARCGSTTIANMLSSVPEFAVYSESGPPTSVALSESIPEYTEKLELFRDIIAAMSRVPNTRATFFKMQSAMSDYIQIFRDAFPGTPWVYLQREPRDVFASQFRNALKHLHKNGRSEAHATSLLNRYPQAPCLRYRRYMNIRPYVTALLAGETKPLDNFNFTTKPSEQTVKAALQASPMKYCAAHLASLSNTALRILRYEIQHSINKGAILNYVTLPSLVPVVVQKHFQVKLSDHEIQRMMDASHHYSKGHFGRSHEFKGDTESKQALIDSMPFIGDAIDTILRPIYDELNLFAAAAPFLPHAEKQQLKDLIPKKPAFRKLEESSLEIETFIQQYSKHPELHTGGTLNGILTKPATTGLSSYSEEMKRGISNEKQWQNPPNNAPGLRIKSNKDGTPPAGYPLLYSLKQILQDWNPDNVQIPSDYGKYASLKVFDYETELSEAFVYRASEVPFVIRNVPNLKELVKKWSDDYLNEKFGKFPRHVETQEHGNHFMFYHRGSARKIPGFKPPTSVTKMTYKEWKHQADTIEDKIRSGQISNMDAPHYYFRASAMQKTVAPSHLRGQQSRQLANDAISEKFQSKSQIATPDFVLYNNVSSSNVTQHGRSLFMSANDFLAKDMEIFWGRRSFFVPHPKHQRGIHCRFGMAGIIAESHYDVGRNFITMERGMKRYILSPPSECKNLDILKSGPSSRHSNSDWSDTQAIENELSKAKALEVIIQEGDALYVPSLWFHYIISLTSNIQCNSRSGNPSLGSDEIAKCGFPGSYASETMDKTGAILELAIEHYIKQTSSNV